MSTSIARAAGLAALLAATGPTAAADRQYGPTSHEVSREGFIIGFSLGAGGLAPDPCHDCGLGIAGDFHLGAMASREVAVMLQLSFVNRGDLTHGVIGPAVQWFPDPSGRFWVKGGIGIGSLDRDTFDDDPLDSSNNHVYPTLFGGGGVEVVRAGRFTIDFQLTGALTRQRDDWARSLTVNIGLNWY